MLSITSIFPPVLISLDNNFFLPVICIYPLAHNTLF